MEKEELTTLIERNKIVSGYLRATSLIGFLKEQGLISGLDELLKEPSPSLGKVEISKRTCEVGALYITQTSIDDYILECIIKGRWDDESNKFFERRDNVDFCKEPIIIIGYNKIINHIAVGHTRAWYLNVTDGYSAKIDAIAVSHPKLEGYIKSAHNNSEIGFRKVSELKMPTT